MVSCRSNFKQRTSTERKVMKLNKQVLLLLIVCSVSVYAACTDRDGSDESNESSDLYEDFKRGLSSAGGKIKDSVTSVKTSLKDGAVKAIDVLSKAAVKTGTIIHEGLTVAVETGKSGYGIVRDKIQGKKPTEAIVISEGDIDVRMLKTSEP